MENRKRPRFPTGRASPLDPTIVSAQNLIVPRLSPLPRRGGVLEPEWVASLSRNRWFSSPEYAHGVFAHRAQALRRSLPAPTEPTATQTDGSAAIATRGALTPVGTL